MPPGVPSGPGTGLLAADPLVSTIDVVSAVAELSSSLRGRQRAHRHPHHSALVEKHGEP